MARAPIPLQRHFKQSRGPLAALLRQADRHRTSLQRVQALLPAEIRLHCLHADLRQSEALVLVDSPVWANRIRYLAPALLHALNQRYATRLKHIRIQTAPAHTRRFTATRRRRAALSANSADVLQSAAAAVADPALAAALQRLARHGTDRAD